jgi:hypothetical protein
MANICIIGTKGVGKSVFLAVLAKRFERAAEGKPRLEFLNNMTSRYVEKSWRKLTNEQAWPDPTPPGQFPELLWRLHPGWADGNVHHLKLLDAPGHDITVIFDPKPDDQPNEKQLALKANIDESDIIIIVISSVKAIEAKQLGKTYDLDIPIKMALDHVLAKKDTRVALLLSQHDEARDFYTEIACSDPVEALRVCGMHALHAKVLEGKDRVKVFHVAAVAETEEFDESGQKLTKPRPKRDFRSEGIEETMGWLVDTLKINESAETRKILIYLISFIALFILFYLFSYSLLSRAAIYLSNSKFESEIEEVESAYLEQKSAYEKDSKDNLYYNFYEVVPEYYYKVEIRSGALFQEDDVLLTNEYSERLLDLILHVNDVPMTLEKLEPNDVHVFRGIHNFSYSPISSRKLVALRNSQLIRYQSQLNDGIKKIDGELKNEIERIQEIKILKSEEKSVIAILLSIAVALCLLFSSIYIFLRNIYPKIQK